ncbi:MAG: cytochrome C assembly protein, partial [Alistipes sp.]|nr:cytochrome C assembly protein [Alistipes sp.]
MMGWTILPLAAALVVALSLAAAVVSARSKGRSAWAVALSTASVVVLGAFIAQLWVVLERPPMRTMGETRLWY